MADPLDLDALEALAAKATPVPWHYLDTQDEVWGSSGETLVEFSAPCTARDKHYIVAACNSVPALVAEVRRLRAEINTLQANKEECDELASEEIARLRAKAARDAEALDALTTWVYEQAGEWYGWTDKMAAHRLVLLLRKTGREPLRGAP